MNDWKALTLRSSLPLKYDLLFGPHNGVSRHIQRLVEKELEEIKLFPLESLKTLKVKVFLISELGFCFDIQDLFNCLVESYCCNRRLAFALQ